MEQGAEIIHYRVLGQRVHEEERQPVVIKSCTMMGLRADDILEGLHRGFPPEICHHNSCLELLGRWNEVVVNVGCDRASSNICVLAALFEMWADYDSGTRSLVPHAEPCASHGTHLCKAKNKVGHGLSAALCSKSKLLRSHRLSVALQAVVEARINMELRIRREPRPQELTERGRRVLKLLLGGDNDDNMLWNVGADGQKRKTALHAATETFLNLLDIDPTNDELCHWCFVDAEHEDYLSGRREFGSPCCDSRAEASEKITVAVFNVMFGRAEERACESRWTQVSKLRRKFILQSVVKRLLPDALRDLKGHYNLSDDLKQMLEHQMAAQELDFKQKENLRLLRVCEKLCPRSATFDLVLTGIAEKHIDNILYGILGSNTRPRHSLLDLLHPTTSTVACAHAAFVDLAESWRPDAEAWACFEALGGDFADEGLRRTARQVVLQLDMGVFDHFSLRWSEAPYSAAPLAFDDATAEEKTIVARSIFLPPLECLSRMARQWRLRYRTVRSFLENGRPSVEAALGTGVVTIDPSERAHAAMKQNILSSGRGRNATAAINHLFCKQVEHKHMDRGGHCVQLAALCDEVSEEEPKGDKNGCMGPYIYFQNLKLKVAKSLMLRGEKMPA